jgi:hypothetical protein
MNPWGCRIACLWAGLCIGGNLIAASAKFQVASLPLSTALEIGQVTFRSVGLLEALLCVALIVLLFLRSHRFRIFCTLPALLFAVQWFAVMPVLHTRTVAIISGSSLPPSNVHFIYMILEFSKVLFLVVAGILLGSEDNPRGTRSNSQLI